MKTVSLIISIYNEEGNLTELHNQIERNLEDIDNLDYELIFVNDGSSDNSLSIMKELLKNNSKVKIVNLIRNFGHEIAMTAGMDYALGDAIIFMDGDLQHPPELIPEFIKHWQDGYDVVSSKRIDNSDHNIFNKMGGKIFYKTINYLSNFHIPERNPDFRLIDRKYIEVIKKMKENNRMFRGLISWLGVTNEKIIEFSAPRRFAGVSKYNLRKLISLAVESIICFSIKPLRIASLIGMFSSMISILLGLWLMIDFLGTESYAYTGYATIVVLIIFIGSVQLIVLGIIGEYIGRIHMEVKNRPLYVAEYLINNQR